MLSSTSHGTATPNKISLALERRRILESTGSVTNTSGGYGLDALPTLNPGLEGSLERHWRFVLFFFFFR